MSTFEVRPHSLTVEPHPSADRLELARAEGFTAVVPKGRFKTGDAGLFVPEGGVLPEMLLRRAGLWLDDKGRGMLSGPKGDRVKPTKLRGVLSDGVMLHPADSVGDDVLLVSTVDYAPALGITKYAAPIPQQMSGKATQAPDSLRRYTDIENVKRYPDVFVDDEPVVATEKVHGTLAIFHLDAHGDFYVSSKGVAGRGQSLVESESNVYWRVARQYDVEGFLRAWQTERGLSIRDDGPVSAFGEIFGGKVQDLSYGIPAGELRLRVFDLHAEGRYLDYDEFLDVTQSYGVARVPHTYLPYGEDGLYALAGMASNIGGGLREGAVVRPQCERQDPELGRVIVKFINPDYLTRKGGTEHQ